MRPGFWWLAAALCALWGLEGASGDDLVTSKPAAKPKSDDKKPVDEPALEGKELIVKYFQSHGLGVESDWLEKNWIKYRAEVQEKMRRQLSASSEFEAYQLNEEVNADIHHSMQKEPIGDSSAPGVEPQHEALMRALDLMVPDCVNVPEYRRGKDDLRLLYSSQPLLAKEMLDRLEEDIETFTSTTDHIAACVWNLYKHFVPLARLAAFVGEHGSPVAAS